jgi:hypothetical protein
MNQKLAGNGQPDEIRRKEGQSRGSSRDGHGLKTRAVKTIRPGGDATNRSAAKQDERNLRGKRRDPLHGPTHRQKRWPTLC